MTRAELQGLCRLISFCHGRVELLEFWWHPARWQPSEVVSTLCQMTTTRYVSDKIKKAIPWRISVDIETNFIIEGPTEEGFIALRRRLRDMLLRGPGRQRRSSRSLGENAGFIFVKRSNDPLPQHTSECMIRSKRRYIVPCNCGPPECYGGEIRDAKDGEIW